MADETLKTVLPPIKVTDNSDGTFSISIEDVNSDAALIAVEASAVDLAALEVINTAIQASVEIMDDWDESDRAKVNPVAGQAGIAANAGAMDALTTRITIASDDTHYGVVGAASDVDGVVHGQLRYIGTAILNLLTGTILAAGTAIVGWFMIKRVPVHTHTTGTSTTLANLGPGAAFKLLTIRIHLGSALAAAETLTVTLNSGTAAAYDTVLFTQDLGTPDIRDVVIPFGDEDFFEATDVIDIVLSANTGSDTWGCETIHELV